MTTWRQRLPMQLTLARIAIALPTVGLLVSNSLVGNLAAAALFVIASITDYYDGYFARKFQAVSTMGKFMDPIADKILVTSVLTMLILPGKIDPFLVILLTVRDTFVGGIRAVAAADGVVIAAKASGKWKTGLQMVGVPALILGTTTDVSQLGHWIAQGGYVIIWISGLLSITSGVEYYRAYLSGRKVQHV